MSMYGISAQLNIIGSLHAYILKSENVSMPCHLNLCEEKLGFQVKINHDYCSYNGGSGIITQTPLVILTWVACPHFVVAPFPLVSNAFKQMPCLNCPRIFLLPLSCT